MRRCSRSHINRDAAARFGIQPQVIDDTLNDAFGQRQVGQYFTQTNSYFIVLEALARPAEVDRRARPDLRQGCRHRAARCRSRRWSTSTRAAPVRCRSRTRGNSRRSRCRSTCSRASRSGRRSTRSIRPRREIGKPQSLLTSFQGNAQAFQSSLSSEPLLILAALLVVYVILGVLYESYVHPLTILSTLPSAGVGALLALWLGGFDLSVIGIIGIILLIGIVKKNGIMLVDFAISREREGMSAGRGDPRSLPAALPADHDDHDGDAARRPAADAGARLRLGTAPAARLRHGRRLDR